LLARIRAVLKRVQRRSSDVGEPDPDESLVYKIGDLKLDTGPRRLSVADGGLIALTDGEYQLSVS
jgi:DNA-binding response OmpR family regulator